MIDNAWIEVTPRERTILLEALSSLRAAGRFARTEIDELTVKLVHSEPHPRITVGVKSGQVQWTTGNPFPVWICDYDGEEGDLPDLDERGQPCRIWLEPADASFRCQHPGEVSRYTRIAV
jgi:hypothetical protein